VSFHSCRIVGKGVNPETYHRAEQPERGSKDFILSPSTLKEFAHCPARWLAGYVPPPSEAKDYGSLFDCLALTPSQFATRFAVQPAAYLHRGMKCPKCGSVTDSQKCAKCKVDRVECNVEKEWTNQSDTCQAWTQEHITNGKQIVTHDEFAGAQNAVKRFLADTNIHEYLRGSDTQVHVVGEWFDDATKLIVPVQCLLDCVPGPSSRYARSAGDVKTTRGAIPAMWSRWSSQRGYHLQAAFDLAMLNAAEHPADGDERDEWYFLVSENFHPWQPAGFILSHAKLDCGRVMVENILARYAKCLATGVWPDYAGTAYPDQVVAGWIIDDITPWDEAAARNTLPAIEDPPPTEEGDVVP
jgi:hypothetical protein